MGFPPYSADGWRLDVAADLGHTAEYNHASEELQKGCKKKANTTGTDPCRALWRSFRLAYREIEWDSYYEL